MSISMINNSAPHLQDKTGIPGHKPDMTPAEAAKEAQKQAAKLEAQAPAGQVQPQDAKQAAAKKLLADTVSISPQGKAASQALIATLGALKPAQAPEPKAKDDDVKNNKDKEEPQPKDGAPAPEDAKAPAPKEGAGGAGGEGGNGGGQPGADEKKLQELKKELKEVQSEIAELKAQATDDAAAQKELDSKNAEEQQLEVKIAAVEQQLNAQA